jgi:hypothetical protein
VPQVSRIVAAYRKGKSCSQSSRNQGKTSENTRVKNLKTASDASDRECDRGKGADRDGCSEGSRSDIWDRSARVASSTLARAKVASMDGTTREKVIRKFSKKKPAYSNCRMLSREGDMLAACDRKKIEWYVAKGLAEWVADKGPDSEIPTIQLNFEHKNADQMRGTDAYYFEAKENHCVGCGEHRHYLKYKIIPDCYRSEL